MQYAEDCKMRIAPPPQPHHVDLAFSLMANTYCSPNSLSRCFNYYPTQTSSSSKFTIYIMAPLSPAGNVTITFPPGYTNHGVEGLLCAPADWLSIILFYSINYLAHCVTIKFYPAESTTEKIVMMAIALFIPSAGLVRALEAIAQYSRLRKGGEVQQAAYAGALIMVVRAGNWTPANGDIIRDILLPKEVIFLPSKPCHDLLTSWTDSRRWAIGEGRVKCKHKYPSTT
jgi:hypothetical protein